MKLLRARCALPVAAATLVAAISGASLAGAQPAHPMTFTDLVSIPRISDVQLSPDGRFVSYTLGRFDWDADASVPHVWVREISGPSPRQLTMGGPESFARWAPDSKRLMYWTRGQLYLVPVEGDQPRQLTHHQTSVLAPPGGYATSGPVWSPDGSTIYFVAKDPPKPQTAVKSPLITFEETDFDQQHLWRVDVASGKEEQVRKAISPCFRASVCRATEST